MTRTHWVSLLLLVVVTAGIYAPLASFDFVQFDDPHFLFENPHLQRGVSAETLRWAVTDTDGNYWHPVTNLAHLFAFATLGPRPGPQHLVNVAIFLATTVALFGVLAAATGRLNVAFVATALWAWHPLRVESVAWLVERSGVLSGFFAVLTLAAYVWYARRGGSLWRYALVALCFALALMCKPTLPALPVALLAMDLWPLGRLTEAWQRDRWRGVARLVLEKAPLLLIAIIFTLVNGRLVAGETTASVTWSDAMLATAAGYGWMLLKTLVPTELAVLYPWATAWSPAASVLALVACAGLTVWLTRARRTPLLAGWIWFVIILLPMLIASRYRASWIADRYAYVPHTLFLAGIAGTALDLPRRNDRQGDRAAKDASPGGLLRIAGITVLALFAFVSALQVQQWRNSETLLRHALDVTTHNDTAHVLLGVALADQGRLAEAAEQYELAIKVEPRNADAHINLGVLKEWTGDLPVAEIHTREGLRLAPENVVAMVNLGHILHRQRRLDAAASQFRAALARGRDSADAHAGLAATLLDLGDRGGAIQEYEAALQANPVDRDVQKALDEVRAGRVPASRPTAVAP